jgi:hypothetical protein
MRFAASTVVFFIVTTFSSAQNKSCQVLSAGEINAALGTHFTQSQAEPGREGQMNCVYGDPEGDLNVRVAVANHIGAADFRKEIIAMNGDNPTSTKPLPGLGDQAELLEIPPSVTGIFARQGSKVIAVLVVGLPPQQAKPQIDKLIRIAFPRL